MSLYDSLDDLLQAADDHNEDEGHNEEAIDKEPPTNEELEKRQECVNTVSTSSFYSQGSRSENQFASFKVLLQILPSVGKVIADPDADVDAHLAQVCCCSSSSLPYLTVFILLATEGRE